MARKTAVAVMAVAWAVGLASVKSSRRPQITRLNHVAFMSAANPFVSDQCLTRAASSLVSFSQTFRVHNVPVKPGKGAQIYMGRRAEKIAARKGKSDAIKGKVYARIGKMIVAAVKAGGDDPVTNKALADALEAGRVNGVPKDNVARAISRGLDKDTSDFKELTYEFYGFGGVGIIVNSLSDNVNRAAADIRTAAKKGGIKVAESGSVAFNFDKKGIIEVSGKAYDEDEVLEIALEAEIDDYSVEEAGDKFTVYVEMAELAKMRVALGDAGFTIDGAELNMVPKLYVPVSDEDSEANEKAIELLEEVEDVDSVVSNEE